MRTFESIMANYLIDYAAYRKQRGYARKTIYPPLVALDRYLNSNNVSWEQLQRPAFFLHLRATISQHPNTTNRMLSHVRSLFDYLVRRQIVAANPLKDIPPVPERYFVPFVFSPKQTDRLLKAVCAAIRREPANFIFDQGVYLAVVMLARCGMRINEPLRLQRDHYRPDEGTVYIEKTKFRKDRLIPLPKAVQKELDDYLRLRQLFGADNQSPYLLASKKQRGFHENQVRYVFHRAVEAIGIRQKRQIIGDMTFGKPVPHSLRHYAEFRIMPSNIPQSSGSPTLWLILLGIIRDF